MDHIQVWTKQGLIPAVLVAVLILSGLFSLGGELYILATRTRLLFSQRLPGEKVAGLKSRVDEIKNLREMLFISDQPGELLFVSNQSGKFWTQDWFEAQNIFAPIVLRQDGESQYILVASGNPSFVSWIERSRNAHMVAQTSSASLLEKNGY